MVDSLVNGFPFNVTVSKLLSVMIGVTGLRYWPLSSTPVITGFVFSKTIV